MDKKQKKIDELRGKQPFRVPEGYMENLVDQVMSQIPEKNTDVPVRISLVERVRPWLYLAAFFAGSVLLIPYLLKKGTEPFESTSVAKVENVQETNAEELSTEVEEDEYIVFMEEKYVDLLLAEEFASLYE